MEKKIEYTNGELTIIWKPELCQHAGRCVKMLPNVYHPKERPWVHKIMRASEYKVNPESHTKTFGVYLLCQDITHYKEKRNR